MSRSFPNKYAADCVTCGGRVEAGAGLTRKGGAGETTWVTTHSTCPSQAPEARTAPEATVQTFTPTAEQREVVMLFATGSDLVVQAGAGTGKTSTLLLLANHAKANGRTGWYGAFNRDIVRDTAKKMPGNVSCSTMHSLAYRAWGARYKARLDSNFRMRPDQVARVLGVESFSIPFGTGFKTLAAGWLAGKVMAAVKAFCQSADPTIERRHFAYLDGVDLPDEAGNRTYENNDEIVSYLLPFARKAWEDLTNVEGQLRYSADCYLKEWSLRDPRIEAGFILFDEAQDADPVQVEIIKNQRKFGTQIVVVGDEQQVIYEWRGAVNALAEFEAMGAKVAFLSQSFRFGDAVAEVANGLLGRLSARLRLRGHGPVASVIGPIERPDAILCRSNAGAVRTVLAEIAAGRRPHLVGSAKDIIWFCEAARDLQAGRSTAHPELACFDSWTAVQQYTSEEEGSDLKLMVKLIDDFGATVIIDALRDQPTQEEADVVISTAHKSKGREWDRVQIASDFMPPKGGGELSAAEMRLAYVAATRAKLQLDIDAVPHFGLDWKPGGLGGLLAGLL